VELRVDIPGDLAEKLVMSAVIARSGTSPTADSEKIATADQTDVKGQKMSPRHWLRRHGAGGPGRALRGRGHKLGRLRRQRDAPAVHVDSNADSFHKNWHRWARGRCPAGVELADGRGP